MSERHLPTGPKAQVEALVNANRSAFDAMLAATLRDDSERFLRICLSAFNKTPQLARCSKETVLDSILQAGVIGLEPNTPAHECALVPYGQECTLQIESQGFVTLAARNGIIVKCADAICQGEEYEIQRGSNPFIHHKIDPRNERGEPVCWYAVLQYPNGVEQFYILTREKFDKIRDMTLARLKKAGRNVKASPYVQWPLEVGITKAIKFATAKAPNKGRELSYAIAIDQGNDAGTKLVDVRAEAGIELDGGGQALLGEAQLPELPGEAPDDIPDASAPCDENGVPY